MIADLAPVERRGEAISYWSVAVYSGLAFGPVIGEVVLDAADYDTVWLVSAALAFAAGMLALLDARDLHLRGARRAALAVEERQPLLNRSALAPAIVLFLGLCGLAGFTELVPLYVEDIGLDDSRLVFLLYGCLILVVRIAGRRSRTGSGSRQAGSLALVGGAAGLAVMAAWSSVGGLVVGTILFAGGMSLMYPAMLTLALTGIDDSQRGSVVGTVSTFFDLSQGLGALHPRRCGRGHERPGWVPRRLAAWRWAGSGCSGPASTRGPAARPCPSTRTTRCPNPSRAPGVGLGTRVDVRAVPARHQRLPAQDRRHPVVPLRAVAPAAARGDDGAHDARTRVRTSGTRRRRSGWSAPASRCCCRPPTLARRIDALAREVRADVVFLDPALPLGLLGPRLRAAPWVVVLHGAEVTVPGRLPGSRQRAGPGAARRGGGRRGGGLSRTRGGARGRARACPGSWSRPASTSSGSPRRRRRARARAERVAARARPDRPTVVAVSRLVPAQGLRRPARRGLDPASSTSRS